MLSLFYHLLSFSSFFFSRRLGVEMGKVQVYQEPNRGELSWTCLMLVFLSTKHICLIVSLWLITRILRIWDSWLSPSSSTIEQVRLSIQLVLLAGSQAGKVGEWYFSSH